MKSICLTLTALWLPVLAAAGQGADPDAARTPRWQVSAEPAPQLQPPRLTATGRLQPTSAIWAMHRDPSTPAATDGGPQTRVPTANPRYAPPVGIAPQIGYAPQASRPLPTYPGIPPTASGWPSYPSRTIGTGPLASLYTDLKASQPGDVLTIVITQQAVAAANAKKDRNHDVKVAFDGGAGALRLLPGFSMDLSGGDSGKTDDQSGFQVATTFTAVVRELTPAGNLLVEGEQIVDMDGQPQWVKLSGEVRPYDVSRNNTVESTKVANVHIEFVGTRAKKHRPGILNVIGGAIESLFGLLF